MFLPCVRTDERLVVFSAQSDSGLLVTVTLVVCDYYFTVPFRAEPLTATVRKCRLRGLFHYVFDVKAVREKVVHVRAGQLFGVGDSMDHTDSCLGRIF